MDDASITAARARKIARQRLESLKAAGVELLPKPRRAAVTEAPAPPVVEPEVPPQVMQITKEQPPIDRPTALATIQREVCTCVRCPHLAEARTQTVFGVGNPNARVVFFGEAPGADEDAKGEPFVGKAGQLLDKIIEACTMKRAEVYILNVLKCRPPGNRAPTDEETANCRGYFERQLEIIKPDYIVCLGATAAKALLNSPWSIGRLRGKFHDYQSAKVVATYHPAYLLRNPSAKVDVWEDMKMMLADMGIEVPKKS
jgi:DNA polymerase